MFPKTYITLLSVVVLCTFQSLFSQDITPKKQDGKWGFINSSKEWIIKPKYEEAQGFSEGVAAVKTKGKWGYINQEGKWAIKPLYGNARGFQEGLAAVLALNPVYNQETRALYLVWGYIDLNGNVAIPFQFRDAGSFEKGTSLVSTWDMNDKSKYYINNEGNEVFPPHVSKRKIKNNIFYVENMLPNNQKVYCYADFENGKLSNWYINDFHQDTFPVNVMLPKLPGNDTLPDISLKGDFNKTLSAFMDKNYKIISPWYDEIGNPSLGYRPVRYNHKWGVVDMNFKYITPPQYIGIQLLKSGLYSVTKKLNKSYLSNEKGEIISVQADRFENFDTKHVLGVYNLDNKSYYCLFDNSGNQRSSWYNKIYPFVNHTARVEEIFPARSEKFINEITYYNYIDDSIGEVISTWRRTIQVDWKAKGKLKDSALQFLYAPKSKYHITPDFFNTILTKSLITSNNKTSFSGSDYHYGMALVAQPYDSIFFNVKGVEYQTIKHKYGYINWNGKLTIPYKFEDAFDFYDGKAIIKKGDKYGAIDLSGRIIIQPKFELMGNFGNGLAPVFIDTAWGFVNTYGKVVIQPQFDDIRPFKNAYAAVKNGKNWGLIDQKGTLILPFEYKKPPEALRNKKIRVLKNGIGYEEIDIPSP